MEINPSLSSFYFASVNSFCKVVDANIKQKQIMILFLYWIVIQYKNNIIICNLELQYFVGLYFSLLTHFYGNIEKKHV